MATTGRYKPVIQHNGRKYYFGRCENVTVDMLSVEEVCDKYGVYLSKAAEQNEVTQGEYLERLIKQDMLLHPDITENAWGVSQ